MQTESFRRDLVPEPVLEAVPEFIDLYYHAWEQAFQHIQNIPGMPCERFMDEGFCRTQVWIWDTCFMALFCKYAQKTFPGIESLDNFYGVMYDGKGYPEVLVPESEPVWTHYTPGTMGRVCLHIPDNPPLFAWAEYENALFSGDLDHVRKLLLEKRYLQKHYEWLENLHEPFKAPWAANPTCWRAYPQGYAWEGGRSGMDNSPRGRIGEVSTRYRPGGPDTLWLDALAQQALSAECIGKLYGIIGEETQAEFWLRRGEEKKQLLRERYWDKEDGFFYDISLKDGSFYKVPTIASYWAMAVGAAGSDQVPAMMEKLEDPQWFGGDLPFVSLARKDKDFDSRGGRYWRGGIWVPTAYVTAYGLIRNGKFAEARRYAVELLSDLVKTYREYEPHTFWEVYDPSKPEPGTQVDGQTIVRKDFCGWTALAPITMLIENVIGIYSVDAFRNEICWNPDRTRSGAVGIQNLRFGRNAVSMILRDGICSVEAGQAFTLIVNGETHSLPAGKSHFSLQLKK